jgi:dephospho-CoA kinase
MTRPTIGLTGGIGSGKSTVADMFAALGAGVVDADQIAHNLTAPNGLAIPTIAARFGESFILPNGAMDRDKMRAHVFSYPEFRVQLEQILHPLIREEAHLVADQTPGAYIICVIPLLVETPIWMQKLDRILVVDCDEQIQIQRVVARNRFSEDQVRSIMAAQVSRAERLKVASDVILNQGDLAPVQKRVEQLHAEYLSLANATRK